MHRYRGSRCTQTARGLLKGVCARMAHALLRSLASLLGGALPLLLLAGVLPTP